MILTPLYPLPKTKRSMHDKNFPAFQQENRDVGCNSIQHAYVQPVHTQ